MTLAKSITFGKKKHIMSLMFSLLPLCHGLCCSAKYTIIDSSASNSRNPTTSDPLSRLTLATGRHLSDFYIASRASVEFRLLSLLSFKNRILNPPPHKSKNPLVKASGESKLYANSPNPACCAVNTPSDCTPPNRRYIRTAIKNLCDNRI